MTGHEERAERIAELMSMFAVYDQTATEGRLEGYLAILAPIPTRSLAEALRSAMADSDGKWPPGPGEIVTSWKANRASHHPAERPYAAPRRREELLQLPESKAYAGILDAVASRVANAGEFFARARALREEHPKRYPSDPLRKRFLSEINAAVELGMPWPISRDFERRLDAYMLDVEDRAWWDDPKRHAITRAA